MRKFSETLGYLNTCYGILLITAGEIYEWKFLNLHVDGDIASIEQRPETCENSWILIPL
jgi:hypothetical protein